MKLRALQYFLILLCVAASTVHAQTPPMSSTDSVYNRARLLIAGGNGAAGRVLVDSMLTVAAPGSPAYGEALFWRATFAASSADAEADFRRVIVEYPLSPRAGDALLKLAQIEVARGDRASAIAHFERFLLENPRSPERPRTTLQLMRLAFEQGQPEAACVFLGRVLGEVPDSDVELRNQLSYYSPRCASVDTTRIGQAAPDSAAKADSMKAAQALTGKGAQAAGKGTPAAGKGAQSPSKGAQAATKGAQAATKGAPSAPTATGKYTLQIAAYTTREEADRLAKRLKDRGLDVRVVGTAKLFRVRVGRYETRAAAAAAQKELKAKNKIDAFVTEATNEEP
jgi:cell division septation protein DedD